MTRYIYRRKATKDDTRAALAAGIGAGAAVAAVVAYFTQLFKRREVMGADRPARGRERPGDA